MQTVRLAVRNLLRRPGFATIAILTLALGIGANTAVFTVFHGVLLAPLPYHRPNQIVILHEQTPQFPIISVTRDNYEDWRSAATSFSGMAAYRPTHTTVTGAGEPEYVPVKMISASLLPVLGVTVEDGRGFGEADDRAGAEPVALVAASFAARRFPAGAVGGVLRLDGQAHTVVGVLPARFELFQHADIYVPFGPWAATLPDDRGWHPGIFPIARLKEGVTLEDARREMDAISRRLEVEYPESNTNVRALVTRVQDHGVQHVRRALAVLLGAVTLVLLIACANVANLLLARGVGRQKEIAVRFALGADRPRIAGQLIVESLVLACVGGAVGLLVAAWGTSFLATAAAGVIPRAHNIALVPPVAVFAVALSVATGLVFGLVPAFHATRCDLRSALNEEGRSGLGSARHRRVRSHLVVAEVALAVVLLVGAGLLLRSFVTLIAIPPGFNPGNLLVVNLPLSPATYADAEVRAGAVARMVQRVRELPGVRGAGITTGLPMAGGGAAIHFNRSAQPPSGPDDYTMTGFRAVTPGYLNTLQVPLVAGRFLEEGDHDRAPRVVVINESMARQFFPDLNPVGQYISLGTEPTPGLPPMEVVGVVGDVRHSFAASPEPQLFVPYGQHLPAMLGPMYLATALVVRTDGDPLRVAGAVRAAVREIDPTQPLVNPRTMEAAMAGTVAQPRLQMLLLALFAGVAVTLAAVGVYGVTAYTVWQRVPEIGMRMALGATPRHVTGMVVWEGARLALVGVGLGLAGASFAARAVEGMLFDVRGLDPVTFVVAPLVLGVAALLATYVPARRAARLSPVEALARQST
jgi:putative ABC transport system permease protein